MNKHQDNDRSELVHRTYPSVSGTDDVEGHRIPLADDQPDDETTEDVEGHVQPPRDLDIERF